MWRFSRGVIQWCRKRYWVTIFAGTVLPAASTGAFEYVMSRGISGWVPLWAGLASGVLTAGVLLLIQNYAPTDERVFSKRTPYELVEQIRGLTDVASKPILGRHAGIWLHASGPVFNIIERTKHFEVHVSSADIGPGFILYFDKARWRDKLLILDRDDSIFAVGRISSISEMFISLKECEVVDRVTSTN